MPSETMDRCISCNRPKCVDGFRFCGGSYCLHEERHPDADEAHDQLVDDEWSNDGNTNE